MFHRFAAASAIASVLIAGGAIASLLAGWPTSGVRVLTTAWCFVPLAWGLWAVLAPSKWVPRKLPLWGAILGVLAGIMAGPVLDLPLRLADLHGLRWIPLVVGPIFYCLIWLLVRLAYNSLRIQVPSAHAASGIR